MIDRISISTVDRTNQYLSLIIPCTEDRDQLTTSSPRHQGTLLARGQVGYRFKQSLRIIVASSDQVGIINGPDGSCSELGRSGR